MLKKNKASLSNNNDSKKNWLKFSSKVCAEQKRSGLKFMLHADSNLKKLYKENTSLSYIYVSSIDQGATRFGGYSSVYVKDGGSPFSQALFINEHWDANIGISIRFVKLLKFKSKSWFQSWRRSSFFIHSHSH